MKGDAETVVVPRQRRGLYGVCTACVRRVAAHLVDSSGGRRDEAWPVDPEEGGADHGEEVRMVARRVVGVVERLLVAEDPGGGKAEVGTEEVDDDAAAHVEHAELDQEVLVDGEDDDLDEAEDEQLQRRHLQRRRVL